jgi:Pyruvate/2-oxoacid:ferredoxin oxidoreductase delta subunit
MHQINPKDEIEERLARYDNWIKDGKIPFSSKVIPINKSVESKQWILPTAQAIEILRNSRIFVLIDCDCRTLFKRCNNPVDVCFVINDAADRYIEKGEGLQITIDEAKAVLEKANEYGLVHLAIYNPEQYIYALCSCCACCCHDLQILKKYQRNDFIAHSDYIAVTDFDKCTGCGICVNRCVFDARAVQDNKLLVENEHCYGCGLCVTTCPEKAIAMELIKHIR